MSLADHLLGAAARTKVPKSFLPFLGQSVNEAIVRYAPTWDELGMARESSATQMRQRMDQARIGGAMIAANASRTAEQLANSPNASSPALASTIAMLTQTARDAPIAATQQMRQAQTEHFADLDKIHASRASLLGTAGAFGAGRYTDLVGADRKSRHDAAQFKANLNQQLTIAQGAQATTRRGQTLSHKDRVAADKRAGQPSTIAKPPSNYPGSPADWNAMPLGDRQRWIKSNPTSKAGAPTVPNPGNITLLTPGEQSKHVTRIQGARKAAQTIIDAARDKGHPLTQAEIEALLRAGKADGVKYTQPQIDVAFDLRRNKGRISNRGAHVLHTIGVSVHGHFKPVGPRAPGPRQAGPVGVTTPLG